VNPTEYDSRWEVIQSSTAWVDPAPSIRISTLRPGRGPGPVPGQLGQRGLDDHEVVGRGVRPGVAGAQQYRQRSPGTPGSLRSRLLACDERDCLVGVAGVVS
jgi:hypothetical protein